MNLVATYYHLLEILILYNSQLNHRRNLNISSLGRKENMDMDIHKHSFSSILNNQNCKPIINIAYLLLKCSKQFILTAALVVQVAAGLQEISSLTPTKGKKIFYLLKEKEKRCGKGSKSSHDSGTILFHAFRLESSQRDKVKGYMRFSDQS